MDSRSHLRRRVNFAWDVERQIHDHRLGTLGFIALSLIYSFIYKVCALLGKHKKCVVGLFIWLMEAVSVVLDVFGKNKMEFLLAAFVLSALGFAFSLCDCIKRRTSTSSTTATTEVPVERQLKVVDLVFSSIQLLVSFIDFLLTCLKVKSKFHASVLPLAYATVAVVFIFKNNKNITSSSPMDSQANFHQDSSSNIQVRKSKIVDKITALQQLVSPFGKTDTASVLMETIGHIKFLQDKAEDLIMENKKDEPNGDLRSRGLCLVPLSNVRHEAFIRPPQNFGEGT